MIDIHRSLTITPSLRSGEIHKQHIGVVGELVRRFSGLVEHIEKGTGWPVTTTVRLNDGSGWTVTTKAEETATGWRFTSATTEAGPRPEPGALIGTG